MKNKLLALFVSNFLFLSPIFGQGEATDISNPVVLVDALVMEQQNLDPKLTLPGVVEPLIEGRLTSEIRGIITRIERRLGDAVKSDDVIMYVKNTQVGQTFREYAVRSPVDGLITNLPVVTGSFVEPNDNLGSVTNTSSLKIVGQVPAIHLSSLRNRQKAEFKIGREVIKAQVSGVSRQVDGTTGTARVELTPTEQKGILVSGIVGELTIMMKELKALAIPLSAQVEIGESSYVRKIVDDKVEVVEVELGRLIGQQRLVVKGLEQGDEIIVRATDYLKDGDRIKRTRSSDDSNEQEGEDE